MDDLDLDSNEVKAFNEGYIIGKHKPEILINLIENNKDNDYVKLLSMGKRQAEKENLITQQKSVRLENKRKAKNHGR